MLLAVLGLVYLSTDLSLSELDSASAANELLILAMGVMTCGVSFVDID